MLPCRAVTSLVFHSGALGDFITALPALRVWRRLHPCGTSVLLGRPAHAELCPGLFDEARDAGAARYASLFSGEPEPALGAESRRTVWGVAAHAVGGRLVAAW